MDSNFTGIYQSDLI